MRAVLLLLLSTLPFLACKSKSEFAPASSSGAVASPLSDAKLTSVKVSRYWNVENVEVSCAAKSCPPQVGILFFFNSGILDRCTATLIENSRILTTGHCDGEIKDGYFVLGSGRERRLRRLQERVFKVFTPNANSERETHAPAGLVFSLNKPISGIPPAHLASGPQDIFEFLTAYVVNLAEEGDEKYKIEASRCRIRRHESLFPYDLSETPDLIWGFDCKAEGGNSGAPLIADGSPAIQAVLQAVVPPEKYALEIRTQLHREPTVYEKHWSLFSTNVRCLSLPGSQPQECTKFDDIERARRFSEKQRVAVELVSQRQVPEKFRDFFEYRTSVHPLAGNQIDDQSFELLYYPTCRKAVRKFKEVDLLSEFIRYWFDEWATPIVESKGLRISKGFVVSASEPIVTLEVEWAKPFGALLLDVEHPRRKWGNRFSIEIPECPR